MSLKWTTLTGLKTIMGVSGSSNDVAFTRCLEVAEAVVLSRTNRPFLFNDGADKTIYPIVDSRFERLLLPRPLVSLTSVKEDWSGYGGHGPDAFGSGSELTIGVDFYPDRIEAAEDNLSALVRIGRWPTTRGSVKVVGQFGYTAAQFASMLPDLVEATYNLAKLVYQSEPDGGVSVESETIGRYAYKIAKLTGNQSESGKDLTDVANVISRYVEFVA